jgi:hypothetical protein
MVNQTVPSAAAAIAMGPSRGPGIRYSTKRAVDAAHRNNNMPAPLSTTSPSAVLIASRRRRDGNSATASVIMSYSVRQVASVPKTARTGRPRR